MAEIVITNESRKRTDGESASAEEMADYLLQNHYPTPTLNRDKLIDLIIQSEEKRTEKEKKECQEEIPVGDTTSKS